MQETSSLDTIIKSIVVKYLETLDDNNKQNLLEDILSSIERNATEKYNKVKSNKINDILRDNILFDSSQKIKALGKILTKLKLTDFSDDYTNDIISNRNKLAHAELIKNDQGKDCFKSKNNEIIFDEEFCKNIRKNLISYREKIENLQENDNFIRL